jgi:hypothetical protein
MDTLTQSDLITLHATTAPICISIFIPTHRAGSQLRQDKIRFRNVLRRARVLLYANSVRNPDSEDLLRPAKRLLVHPTFWQCQSDGLAVFLAPGTHRVFRVPLRFEETVTVHHRFHLKPLMPLLNEEQDRWSPDEAAQHMQALSATEQVSGDLRTIVPAACAGQVETLFIDCRAHVWGHYDAYNKRMVIKDTPEGAPEDLLDRAAVESYACGGKVFVVPREKMPVAAPAAALLRHPNRYQAAAATVG